MDINMQNILEHYKNPDNYGVIDDCTHEHFSKNISCGDEVTVYLKVSDNKLSDLKFEARGCAISVAALSMLSDEIIGMSVEDVLQVDKDLVLEMLGIDVGPVRLKCALIGLEAVKEALRKES